MRFLELAGVLAMPWICGIMAMDAWRFSFFFFFWPRNSVNSLPSGLHTSSLEEVVVLKMDVDMKEKNR
jgi:hypothetical protein